jgi:mRNA-degrading endonuclease RelE of RelBE toxin-antitoxin system
MNYSVKLKKSVDQKLRKLSQENPVVYHNIVKRLMELQGNPFTGKRLVGPLRGKYSERAGDYRILYSIQGSDVIVEVVAIRRQIY